MRARIPALTRTHLQAEMPAGLDESGSGSQSRSKLEPDTT